MLASTPVWLGSVMTITYSLSDEGRSYNLTTIEVHVFQCFHMQSMTGRIMSLTARYIVAGQNLIVSVSGSIYTPTLGDNNFPLDH